MVLLPPHKFRESTPLPGKVLVIWYIFLRARKGYQMEGKLKVTLACPEVSREGEKRGR
jgi:hypothetical protein